MSKEMAAIWKDAPGSVRQAYEQFKAARTAHNMVEAEGIRLREAQTDLQLIILGCRLRQEDTPDEVALRSNALGYRADMLEAELLPDTEDAERAAMADLHREILMHRGALPEEIVG